MTERMVNLSPSIPMGLYERIAAPVSRGAIASFAIRDVMTREQAAATLDGTEIADAQAYSGRDLFDARLCKRVVGVPGDIVTTSTRKVMVNGRVVGRRFSRSEALAEGCPFYWRNPRHVLAADEVFLLSDDVDQCDERYDLDSRYLGPIKMTPSFKVWQPVAGGEVKTRGEAREMLDRLNGGVDPA